MNLKERRMLHGSHRHPSVLPLCIRTCPSAYRRVTGSRPLRVRPTGSSVSNRQMQRGDSLSFQISDDEIIELPLGANLNVDEQMKSNKSIQNQDLIRHRQWCLFAYSTAPLWQQPWTNSLKKQGKSTTRSSRSHSRISRRH